MTRDEVIATSRHRIVSMHDTPEYTSKITRVTVDIPKECPACGFKNFNVWGTKMNGIVSIVVKCMRCGK